MERIFEISQRLTSNLPVLTPRYLYNQISWEDRMIMIKGARGVGKTTMLCQRCKEIGLHGLYASLDNLYFNDHRISEVVDYHYKHGGTHLFLDEVHLYPHKNWEQEIKNIYDSYPNYHIIFTGSSLLHLNQKSADLSRRVAIYELRGLSFREYLNFARESDFPVFSFSEVLNNHREIASELIKEIKILPEFENYLLKGYYPFFLESSGFTYSQRVERMVRAVIELDIPALASIEYETQNKLKKLLVVLAEQVPFVPNITNLSRDIGVTRNQLIKFFGLLNDGGILRMLGDATTQPKRAAKPEKILFDNPSIMQALGIAHKAGTIRESFGASMLSTQGELSAPKEGDILLNKKILFEIGGKGKDFSQIADKSDSFVLADNIEIVYGNKIPLWLIGFLY